MAIITPGNGSTITAITLESFLTGAIWLLQNLEADPARNPTSINNVTSSISDDSRSLTASCNFRATVEDDTQGRAVIQCIDYLTTPSGASGHWVAGTGGSITAATIQAAIFEAARMIDAKENSSTTNPTGAKNISWSVSNGDIGSANNSNVLININNFPLTFSLNANGTQSLIGKEYLS